MSELHLEDNYLISPGLPVDPIFFEKKVYTLITIFGASNFLYSNFKKDNNDFFIRSKEFEKSEGSELLISIAVISRSYLDTSSVDNNFNKDCLVGKIIFNNINKEEGLNFRESCNKIIHATNINFDIDKGNNIKDGYIKPIVYLYGSYKGKEWKATVNIIDFCKAAINSF